MSTATRKSPLTTSKVGFSLIYIVSFHWRFWDTNIGTHQWSIECISISDTSTLKWCREYINQCSCHKSAEVALQVSISKFCLIILKSISNIRILWWHFSSLHWFFTFLLVFTMQLPSSICMGVLIGFAHLVSKMKEWFTNGIVPCIGLLLHAQL